MLLFIIVFFENSEHEKNVVFYRTYGHRALSTAIVLQTLHVGQTWIMGLVNPFELLGGAYDWFIPLSFAFLGLGIFTWYLHNYLHEKFKSKFFAYFSLLCTFLGVFTTRMLFYGLINTRTFLMQKLAIDIFINFLQNPPNHFLLEKLKK